MVMTVANCFSCGLGGRLQAANSLKGGGEGRRGSVVKDIILNKE